MTWLTRILGAAKTGSKREPRSELEELVDEYNEERQRIRDAGSVDGAHYTDHVELVKEWKRQERYIEAEKLLLQLVSATERESKAAGEGWGVAPWYYEQLAIIYRKQKRFADEVSILERYEAQPKAPGAGPSKLGRRLVAARKKLVSGSP